MVFFIYMKINKKFEKKKKDVCSCVVAALWNVVEVRGLSVVLILAAVLLLFCGMLLWLDS